MSPVMTSVAFIAGPVLLSAKLLGLAGGDTSKLVWSSCLGIVGPEASTQPPLGTHTHIRKYRIDNLPQVCFQLEVLIDTINVLM